MRRADGPPPKPNVVVTWFMLDPDDWTVTFGSPECEPMIGRRIWDLWPHLEEHLVPHHLLAVERGHAEFLCSDEGHGFFVRSVWEDGLLHVTSIDLLHLTESLRNAPVCGDVLTRSQPALRLVGAV